MNKVVNALLLLLIAQIALAQQFFIYGRVYSIGGEAIVGAQVYVKNANKAVITDNYGYFSLKLNKGNWIIEISHLAYENKRIVINLKSDTSLTIFLTPLSYELNQVEIVANKGIVQDRNLNMYSVPVSRFNRMPVVFGEKDLFKGVLTLPGLQPGFEGTSQLNIRGGTPEQNLILIDDMPIYYVTHLYGFLSTFNSEAVKSLKLYKGGFPAEYNDLSSGMIDIVLKDGDLNNRHFSLNISPLAISTSLDGYLVKGKSSFTLYARRAMIDNFINIAKFLGMDIPETYKFYDFNAKLRIKINPNNTIYFSFFNGQDKYLFKLINYETDSLSNRYKYTEGLTLGFGNTAGALRWFSILSKKLTLTNVAYFSFFEYHNDKFYQNYNQTKDSTLQNFDLLISSKIKKFANRLIFNYLINNNLRLKFGSNFSFQQYHSAKIGNYLDYLYSFQYKEVLFDTIMSVFNLSPFISLDYNTKSFDLYLGLTNNNYLANKVRFYYLEPRVRLQVKFNGFNLQFSYVLTHQFKHILKSSAINMPSDLYLGSTYDVPPIKTIIYDLGFKYKTEKFSFSLSGFYKNMENLIRYLPGTDLLNLSGDWTSFIDKGNGWAYGLEFLLEKNIGKFTGWFAFTYSRSYRQFNYTNAGQIFRYRFDRPIVTSLTINYKLSKSLDISFLWTLYSGHLITLPTHYATGYFFNLPIEVFFINYFSEINNFRTPTYHRADIALNYHKQGSKSYWTFGIYNLYNRLNPIYLEPLDSNTLQGFTLFPFMPFVSYKYEIKW